MNGSITGIILAAGKGTRMKSRMPKVLHCLLGRPLLWHVLYLLRVAGVKNNMVVVGHRAAQVKRAFEVEGVEFVIQEQQLGTAHAVAVAMDRLKGQYGDVIIMCGDTPLFYPATLKEFIRQHRQRASDVSILSAAFSDPAGYGRIIRDVKGQFLKITEEKDASLREKAVKEVNSGTYLARGEILFELVAGVECKNAQGEYYLTDIVELARKKGYKVDAFCVADEEEALGINSRSQLAKAELALLYRIRQELMGQGVSLSMPETIYIERQVRIGRDSIVGPHCVIKGTTVIGENVRIGAFSFLRNAKVASGTRLPPYSVVEGTAGVEKTASDS